jgi:hypothetical protein
MKDYKSVAGTLSPKWKRGVKICMVEPGRTVTERGSNTKVKSKNESNYLVQTIIKTY